MVLLGLLILSLGGFHTQEELLNTKFERPYFYTVEKGKSVKKTLRYPNLEWEYREGYSCINEGDYINLIQFLIQVNGTLDQYEAAGERGE